MQGSMLTLNPPRHCPAFSAGARKGPRPTVRSARLAVRVRATQAADAYISPSSRTAATELQALERFSEIVPDVLLSQTLQSVEAPKAATSSRGVLAGILSSPSSFGRYKFAVEQARHYDRAAQASSPAEAASLRVDKALVNVGSMFLENVSGRVSTEVDPRAHDSEEALVARGQSLIRLYEEVGVSRDRVVLRIPATWAGIRAAAALEAEGIATHLVLVYGFTQGAAAAQAGVSVIQPNVGAVADWYKRHPGVIKNPKGPREAALAVADEYGESVNPGLVLVETLYHYVKRFHPKTRIMASGLRTKAEALRLAGCDYLVVGPRVLEALAAAATLEGYNDGLRADEDEAPGELAPALTPAAAQAHDFSDQETATLDRALFEDRLGLAARELLREGVARLIGDAERLEAYFLNLAGGQE
ncbi:TAL2 [Auxenochlorella protothecoides x Auxenochlorella symbiontica]